jgi:Spy/CpxP family protein refolding chaperone
VKRVLVVLAAILFAASAQAQVEGKWWKRPRIVQALGLTPQQTADLEKIFAKSRPKIIDLKADLEKKQFAYQEAMTSDKVNRQEVAALIEAREQARAQLQKELSLMELDMRQVLTPDQREKAEALRAQLRQRIQDRRRMLRDAETEDEGGGAAAPPPAQSPRNAPRKSPPPNP